MATRETDSTLRSAAAVSVERVQATQLRTRLRQRKGGAFDAAAYAIRRGMMVRKRRGNEELELGAGDDRMDIPRPVNQATLSASKTELPQKRSNRN